MKNAPVDPYEHLSYIDEYEHYIYWSETDDWESDLEKDLCRTKKIRGGYKIEKERVFDIDGNRK